MKKHILKNGATVWKVKATDEHGRVRKFSARTRKEAQEWLDGLRQRRRRVAAGLPLERGPIRYHALCDLYLAQHDTRSRDWFKGMLAHSRKKFGHHHVRAIRSDDVAVWLHSLPHAPKTKQHILDAMRQVLRQGVEWGYLEVSPVRPRAIKPPAKEATKIKPFNSWREVIHLASKMPREDAAIVRFICSTGLRPEEAFALSWQDIDLCNNVIHIRQVWVRSQLHHAGKTPGALRTVALSLPARNAVESLDHRSGVVFQAPNGGRIHLTNWRRRRWYPALDAAGLERRPLYQMRHTFATLALAQGCSLEWISEQMGHTDIRTTKKFYARFTKRVDDRQRALLDQMEAA